MGCLFNPPEGIQKKSLIKDYEELLKMKEEELERISCIPYNSQHRDCETAIKKYKSIIKQLGEV